MKPWLPTLLATFTLCAGAQAASFDCAQARTAVEHRVCDTPTVAQLDEDMGHLYSAMLKKADRPGRQALRTQQRRWLATQRNRCEDAACLETAYRSRLAALLAENNRPLELGDAAFEPLFSRPIRHINDSVLVRGLTLRADTPRRLQLELHVDPTDHLNWRMPGPRVVVACTEPDAREGYANRINYRTQAHGLVDFVPVRRTQGQGYILMELNLGKGLPLKEDLLCHVAFTEWLLDKPSTLYLVDATPRR